MWLKGAHAKWVGKQKEVEKQKEYHSSAEMHSVGGPTAPGVRNVDTFITYVFPWALSEELKDNGNVVGHLAAYRTNLKKFRDHQERYSVRKCGHFHRVRYTDSEGSDKGHKLATA